MLSYHSYSCAQRTWGWVAYRGIWDRVTHCVAWKAVSNVSWVYGLIHLTHSCIPVYSICSAHSPPHICLQWSFYIADVHRSKQYKCNELTWMMVSWHITWGAPGCLLSTGCAMAMNIMRRVSFSTTKNSVSFVSVNLSPWLPWASHLCTWSSSSAPGEQGLNSNQKGSSPPLCLYQCADEIHLFLNQPILSTLLQFFLWDSLFQFELLLLNNLWGKRIITGTKEQKERIEIGVKG